MKIVMITPYWLRTKGGITTAVYYLSNELKRNGHLVYVFTPDGGSGAVRIPRNGLNMAWKTTRILQNINPEVIHVHAHGSLLLAPVIYKTLLNKHARVIFTFHTQPHTISFLARKPAKERGMLRRALFNFLLRYCNATTYVSQNLMNSLREIEVKIVNPVVISNGVDAKAVKPDDVNEFKKMYNLTNTYPILCMIAKLEWDWKIKGVIILIQAFKKVLISEPKAQLLIVGNGKYRELLEDYVKNESLEEKVIFTANMDNPFIALSVCDIYSHVSLNEACPIAPLEAMIAGKPIIASNDGGLPEIITDGFDGILVNSNSKNVAKAILTLVEKPDFMQDLSKKAVITATTRFSWTKITREYIKVYENEL